MNYCTDCKHFVLVEHSGTQIKSALCHNPELLHPVKKHPMTCEAVRGIVDWNPQFAKCGEFGKFFEDAKV